MFVVSSFAAGRRVMAMAVRSDLTESGEMTMAGPLPVLETENLFGAALREAASAGDLVVERRGGGVHPTSLHWWLRADGADNPVDFASIAEIAGGPVLDVGCATGRHVEALAGRGIAADGIDINPVAVAVARENGCDTEGRDVLQADFWRFMPERRYRWLLALGNNLGIAGRLAGLPLLLQRFAALLVPGGQVLASSVDWNHPAVIPAGHGYPGEIQMRHRYGGRVGPWFDWLYVAPETLRLHADRAGFHCRIVERHAEVYVVVLTRNAAVAA